MNSIELFTSDQVELIRRTIMPKGASDDELRLFVGQVQRTGLDPFSRQIYATIRYDKAKNANVMSIGIGIDGARLIAERSRKYQGQDGPYWCGEDGVWRDVWLSKAPPVAARVGVLKQGFIAPLYGVALYSEYAQTKQDGSPTYMWQTKPALMLAKCAEALALRKAFPMELSGLYTDDEMGMSEVVVAQVQGQPALPTGPMKVDASKTLVQNAQAAGGVVTMTIEQAAAYTTRNGKPYGELAPEELDSQKQKLLAALPTLKLEQVNEANDRLRALDLLISQHVPPEPEFPAEGL